jgi:hypothetical protein
MRYLENIIRGILTEKKKEGYLNKNFWDWFGDSKMKDSSGTPMVFYHGTNRKFDEFDPDAPATHDPGYYGKGFYFTFGHKFSKDEASYYGSNILEVFLKVENPFYFSDLMSFEGKQILLYGESSLVFLYNLAIKFPELNNVVKIDEKHAIGILPRLFKKYERDVATRDGFNGQGDEIKIGYLQSKTKTAHYDYTDKGGRKGAYTDYDDIGRYAVNLNSSELKISLISDALSKYEGISPLYHAEGYMTRNESITKAIRDRGYDGIMQSPDGDEVVVFNPNQIKSATNNNGFFSLKSNNIYL